MQTVTSLAEAKQWFLRNSQNGEKGSVVNRRVKCQKDSRSRICSSFDEAVIWYNQDSK